MKIHPNKCRRKLLFPIRNEKWIHCGGHITHLDGQMDEYFEICILNAMTTEYECRNDSQNTCNSFFMRVLPLFILHAGRRLWLLFVSLVFCCFSRHLSPHDFLLDFFAFGFRLRFFFFCFCYVFFFISLPVSCLSVAAFFYMRSVATFLSRFRYRFSQQQKNFAHSPTNKRTKAHQHTYNAMIERSKNIRMHCKLKEWKTEKNWNKNEIIMGFIRCILIPWYNRAEILNLFVPNVQLFIHCSSIGNRITKTCFFVVIRLFINVWKITKKCSHYYGGVIEYVNVYL